MNAKKTNILTDTFIRQMEIPKESRTEVFDGRVNGLILRVTSKGIRSWCYRYRFANKDRRMTLGHYPDLSLKEAREKATEATKMVREGNDPARERNLRESKRGVEYDSTFVSLSEKYLREHVRGEKHYIDPFTEKPLHRQWKETERILEKEVVPVIGHLPLSDIKKADIIALLAPIKAKAPYVANNVLKLIKGIYNWALSIDLVEMSPCLGMKAPHKAEPRNRPLNDEEIRKFWEACLEEGYPYGDAFRLLLITGQRRGEVGEMPYNELDRKNEEWILPPERAKNKRRHVVPLSPLALDVIKSIPNTGGDYLFSTHFGEKPINGYTKPIKRVLKSAGLENVCIKDLRETVATTMRQRLGISTDVIGQVLNHAPRGVTQRHYASASSIDDIRDALEKWDDYLSDLVLDNEDAHEGGNILPFPKMG